MQLSRQHYRGGLGLLLRCLGACVAAGLASATCLALLVLALAGV